VLKVRIGTLAENPRDESPRERESQELMANEPRDLSFNYDVASGSSSAGYFPDEIERKVLIGIYGPARSCVLLFSS